MAAVLRCGPVLQDLRYGAHGMDLRYGAYQLEALESSPAPFPSNLLTPIPTHAHATFVKLVGLLTLVSQGEFRPFIRIAEFRTLLSGGIYVQEPDAAPASVAALVKLCNAHPKFFPMG